jgi:hypothetical protein
VGAGGLAEAEKMLGTENLDVSEMFVKNEVI